MARKLTADQIHDRIRKLEDRTNVSAHVVLNANGDHVGTIRFHYPRDGAGRLTAICADWTLTLPTDAAAYEAWTRWQIGTASGWGYDKRTAALGGLTVGVVTFAPQGYCWDSQLRAAGYQVIQAV